MNCLIKNSKIIYPSPQGLRNETLRGLEYQTLVLWCQAISRQDNLNDTHIDAHF
jgi:hypothetical protein